MRQTGLTQLANKKTGQDALFLLFSLLCSAGRYPTLNASEYPLNLKIV